MLPTLIAASFYRLQQNRARGYPWRRGRSRTASPKPVIDLYKPAEKPLEQKPDFDVGIIGGGPAGSSLAAYLAKAGVKCVVFERELFPRAHVGESLVPSSTRVFNELGFMEQMEEAKFPHKLGAVCTANEQA